MERKKREEARNFQKDNENAIDNLENIVFKVF